MDSPLIGGLVVSSTSPTKLPEVELREGAQLKANAGNTGLIYLGNADVTDEKCYPLSPGESVFIPIDRTQILYFLAEDDGNIVNYILI